MVSIETPGFSGPNAEQIRYWNGAAGESWVHYEDALDRVIAPIGERVLARADAAPRERVVDIGCGCGATSVELARRVGPSGRVLGVDVSQPMLGRALARAKAHALTNTNFVLADAQTEQFGEGQYDLAFSRFGVMFFSDPTAAFANLRRALRVGGRIVFVCWQPIERNPWMLVPAVAISRHVPVSPPDPTTPGPFSLANPERLHSILSGANLSEIVVEAQELSLAPGGGDLDRAVEFALQIGPGAAALRAAGAGPELRARAARAVREQLAPFAKEATIEMQAAFWLVCARREG